MSKDILSDILTTEEVSEIFKLPLNRVKSLARRGDIPAKKVGKDWRFKASEINKWFSDWQPNNFDPNKKAGEIIEALNGKKKDRL